MFGGAKYTIWDIFDRIWTIDEKIYNSSGDRETYL